MTTTSLGYFFSSLTRSGKRCRQLIQHNVQKSRMTILPRRSLSLIGLSVPRNPVAPSKSGARKRCPWAPRLRRQTGEGQADAGGQHQGEETSAHSVGREGGNRHECPPGIKIESSRPARESAGIAVRITPHCNQNVRRGQLCARKVRATIFPKRRASSLASQKRRRLPMMFLQRTLNPLVIGECRGCRGDRRGAERPDGGGDAGAARLGRAGSGSAARPGGAVYSEELTLPGYLHDVGAAFFPFADDSPAFRSLDLAGAGLRWGNAAARAVIPRRTARRRPSPAMWRKRCVRSAPMVRPGGAWPSGSAAWATVWRRRCWRPCLPSVRPGGWGSAICCGSGGAGCSALAASPDGIFRPRRRGVSCRGWPCTPTLARMISPGPAWDGAGPAGGGQRLPRAAWAGRGRSPTPCFAVWKRPAASPPGTRVERVLVRQGRAAAVRPSKARRSPCGAP